MSFCARFLLFAMATALLWTPTSARAQLHVIAPAAPAQALSSWYAHHIPLRYRAVSTLTVRELPDADMDAYLINDNPNMSYAEGDEIRDIDGVFESHPDRMALRLPQDHKIDWFTFAHEYGHYIWFERFSESDRRRYETIYKRQRAAGMLVTHYARSDVEEGFAEAFSFYAAEPPILAHRDSLSYQFLAQWPRDGSGASQ